MIYFSGKTRSFYVKEIHGSEMPDDVIGITEEWHAHLLESMYSGEILLISKSGHPYIEGDEIEN